MKFSLLAMVLWCGYCSNKSEIDHTIFKAPGLNQLPPGVTPINPPVDAVAPVSATPVRGMIAIQAVEIGAKTSVLSDIAVLDKRGNPRHHRHHHDAAELIFKEKTSSSASYTLKADTIKIAEKANIASRLEANHFEVHAKATAPNRNPLVSLPELPMFLTGTPGNQDIGASTAPLAAGHYRKLKIADKKALMLAGGFYQFSEIDLGEKSSLVCVSGVACVVTVKKEFNVGEKAIVRAASGSSNDLIFYVEGSNSSSQSDVVIGEKSTITANIYAPNGLLKFGNKVQANGIFIGLRIKVGEDSRITGAAAPADSVSKLFEAGVAGMIELPGKAKLEIPACALTEDVVISAAAKLDAGAHRMAPGDWHFYPETAVDLQPTGLNFACPVTLTQNYPSQLEDGANPYRLTSLSSPDDLEYSQNAFRIDPAAGIVSTRTRHFTVYVLATPPVSATGFFTMERKGNALYALPENGVPRFYIYDVSNPESVPSPTSVNIPFGSCTWTSLTTIKTYNNFLLVIQVCSEFSFYYRPKLTAYDISNPLNPVLYSDVLFGSPRSDISGGLRWSYFDNGFYYAISHDFNLGGQFLRRFDLRNPASPVVTHEITPTVDLTGFYGEGDYFVLNNYWEKYFRVFYAPTLTDTGNTVAMGDPLRGWLGQAHLTSTNLFFTERMSANPSDPTYLTKYDRGPGGMFTNPRSVPISSYFPPAFAQLTTLTSGSGFILSLADANAPLPSSPPATPRVLLFRDTLGMPVLEDSLPLARLTDVSSTGQIIFPGILEYPYAYIGAHMGAPLRILKFQGPPSITLVTPADGADSITTSTPISVTFNQAMNPATLTASITTSCTGTVQVSDTDFTSCIPMAQATGVMTNGNTTVTFTPAALVVGRRYKIRVTTGVQSSVGASMTAPFQQANGWVTATRPVVVGAQPIESSINVPVNVPITITFDQPMNPATLTASMTPLCAGTVQVLDNFGTCVVMTSASPTMSSGNTVATFTPVGLSAGSIYKIRVTLGAQSAAGLSILTAFTQPAVWTTIFGPVGPGNLIWIRQGGGTDPATASGQAVATDSAGNIYVTGASGNNFNGFIFPSQNGIFVAKYAPSGNIIWTVLYYGGPYATANASGIIVDNAGSLLITGNFAGDLDGLPVNIPNSNDGFVAKLNTATGAKQWIRNFGSSPMGGGGGHVIPRSIAVDPADNIVIAGFTGGSIDGEFFDGFGNGFVIKYDNSGNRQWTRLLNGISTELSGVTTNSMGEIFTTGVTQSTIDGQPLNGISDIMLNKFAADGARIWSKLYGAANVSGSGKTVRVDSGNNILIYANSWGSMLGQVSTATSGDTILVKTDSTGVVVWAKIHNAAPLRNDAHGMVVDSSGSVYCVGTTHDPVFLQGIGLKLQGYLTKFDSSGNVSWTRLIGQTFRVTWAYGMALDTSGAAYVSGITDANLSDQVLRGAYDYFLAKYQ